MSATAFSSPETVVLERKVENEDVPAVTFDQLWNEIHQKVCIRWIRQNGFKRICLQFPDAYLAHSVKIDSLLKEALADSKAASAAEPIKTFILADTSYGSCCVDEIAAAHVSADSIIHFGNACRSKVSRLPVLYMFPHLPLAMDKFYTQLENAKSALENRNLYIFLDVGYHYILDHAPEDNELAFEEQSFSCKIKELTTCKSLHIVAYPAAEEFRSESETNTDSVCLFVGADNSNFSVLSLSTEASKWFVYDTSTAVLSEKNPLTANYVRRRYYYIEKCKDARVLGLVVATLTADGFLQIIERIQQMAHARGIETQIFSVGRINPAKLANFLEVDCYVLIGCPFNNGYTSKDYYKPMISVFEAEMALNPAWHMKYPDTYVTDFKELLPKGKSFLPFKAEDIQQHDVSLVSGQLRNLASESKHDGNAADFSSSVMESSEKSMTMARPKMELMTSNTGLTFEDRTWKGLEPKLGQTEPAKLTQGLRGIPIRYTQD